MNWRMKVRLFKKVCHILGCSDLVGNKVTTSLHPATRCEQQRRHYHHHHPNADRRPQPTMSQRVRHNDNGNHGKATVWPVPARCSVNDDDVATPCRLHHHYYPSTATITRRRQPPPVSMMDSHHHRCASTTPASTEATTGVNHHHHHYASTTTTRLSPPPTMRQPPP